MKWFLILFLLLPLTSLASNRVLNYEPAIVELAGVLDLQTFPGLPNYENIESGDEAERHFYLKLNVPIKVSSGRNSKIDNPVTENNVKIVQLVIGADNEGLWSKFRSAGKGAHVNIRGGLFHRFTGHHHARVLLNVESMERLKD